MRKATRYPNSQCEKHKDVTVDSPVCIVCLMDLVIKLQDELNRDKLLNSLLNQLNEMDAECKRLTAELQKQANTAIPIHDAAGHHEKLKE